MATLRDELGTYLKGWRSDLSPAWIDFFEGAAPDLTAVDTLLPSDPTLPVIPGRRGAPLAGAPAGAHVFRACPADRFLAGHRDPFSDGSGGERLLAGLSRPAEAALGIDCDYQ